MDKPGDGIHFPGGKCPRLELVNAPENIKPLTAVCAEATALASNIMRTGRSTSYVAPVAMDVAVPTNGQDEPQQRTESERMLGELLRRQATLAEDVSPAGEQEYQRVVAEIARVTGEIDAARRVETQHG
jgi:hypothetical protein